jgi:hypothetical protein
MKSRASLRQHPIAATASLKPVSITLSSNVGGRASANDEHTSAPREHAVNPLWMIAVAMAFTFALLMALTASG